MDFALTTEWLRYPDEFQGLELAKPPLDRAATPVEFLLKSAVPLPAGIRTETVEIAEKVFFGTGQQPEFFTTNPDR